MERKTADERPGAENEKARKNADLSEPVNEEKSAPPSRRRVESWRRRASNGDAAQSAAVGSERTSEDAAFSGANA